MPAPDPFLQLVPNRALAAVRRVAELVWHSRRELAVEATAATPEHLALAAAKRRPRRAVRGGEAWGRLYDQRWCRVVLPAPPRGATGPRYLEWQDQGEATLWVEGKPYYGFDVAHRRVALPAGARELWIESYCCQSAIWHPAATGLSPRGSVFGGAWLAHRDDAAWSALHDLQCLVDLLLHERGRQTPAPPPLSPMGHQPPVTPGTPAYRRLLRVLAEAVDAFDTGGLAALRRRLGAAYRELRNPRPLLRAALTGHAHVDLVWLWPERIGEAKAVHTFATVDRLFALYPEFRFAYSQPASYAAVARRAPALARAVSRHVRAGRWEPTGALYVESDTLLPCGEALARSLLVGQDEFRRLRGSPAKLCWLPDVFGYTGCLPQLLRLAGVEWFFTTKLAWSAINRFPYSSFVWRGTDGSEVVAHVTQDSGYNNLVDLPRLHAAAHGHAQSDVHPELLHPTGYGDGGGGPTEEMCERARRLDALGDTPALTWDQPEAFFARLAKRRSRLPVWQGNCDLEYHRGTYTTHGDLKLAFRELERALQVREAAAVARGRAPDLRAAWRRMVFAQFHDYIPGSSVPEVYAEAVPELRRLAVEQLAATRTELGERANGPWRVFNPLPQPWRGWVRAPGRRAARWVELPPLASVALDRAAGSPPAPVVASDRTLDNGIVRAELDARGFLRRLRFDGRDVPLAGPAAVPVLYPDRPAAFESWDIDRAALDLGRAARARCEITVERRDPTGATIVVRRPLGRASTLALRFTLRAGEPVLRVTAELDWHEPQTLLKLHFPTRYAGRLARFGAPFGSTLRGQQPGEPLVEAQWETAASRWAAVANDGEREGLALITAAKFGFSARAGDLAVSLVRSATVTGFDNHDRAAPRTLSRLAGAARFSDHGLHTIELALAAHEPSAPRERQPAALADSLFTTPLVFRGAAVAAGLRGLVGGETLVPAWAMPLDRASWLLRLHETSGQRGVATLDLAPGWTAVRCGLDGTVARGAVPSHRLAFRPYEIVSIRLGRSAG